jgi:hypothetical protein
MDERTARVAAILEEAERAHAAISAKTAGADPEWALFYAWWLRGWSDLPELIRSTPTMSGLIHELVRLDRAYRRDRGAVTWSEFYARELLSIDWTA